MRSHRGRGATLPRQWSPRPASKTEDRSVTWFHPLWRHVLQRPDFQIEQFPRRVPGCKDRIMPRNVMKDNCERTTHREAKGAPGVSRVPESGWPLPLENAECGIRNGEWGRRNGRWQMPDGRCRMGDDICSDETAHPRFQGARNT